MNSHVVVKSYLDKYVSAEYVIHDDIRIDINNNIIIGNGVPELNKIYIVTDNSGTLSFIPGQLYMCTEISNILNTDSFSPMLLRNGNIMISTNKLGDNNTLLKFNNATLYIWDKNNAMWYEGFETFRSGMTVTKAFNVSYENSFSSEIFSEIVLPPKTKLKEISIDIKERFTGDDNLNSNITLEFGRSGIFDLLKENESDLNEVGFFIYKNFVILNNSSHIKLYFKLNNPNNINIIRGFATVYIEYILN